MCFGSLVLLVYDAYNTMDELAYSMPETSSQNGVHVTQDSVGYKLQQQSSCKEHARGDETLKDGG